ncbi:AraC family transcriptional regulator [Siccirubricoccus phaeus]|uniref:AraC family transcriptional regulator n=1 Tax=Siccirubricoccus phaeus TaxID=2595053 RepID=UPI0011F1D908|nr:AraC family transcriptional regulator [Siccirubricoccus phaeus]
MRQALRDLVRRYTDAHANAEGVALSPIPGLATVRATAPSGLLHAIPRPLICLVLQGEKEVRLGRESFTFAAGDSLLVTADVPTVSRITRASRAAPYLALVLELDPAILADLGGQVPAAPEATGAAVRADPTEAEVTEAALRLMRLLDRPPADAVLLGLRLREMHYWLLAGRHGAAIRRLGWPEGQVQRVARAVALLRAEFAQPLPVERLARAAGMSPSSFHRHFRAVTSLSPLQFQKQLRLMEARRLMLAEGASASHAAFLVGYESVPQFTREYGRMFGLPPVRDAERARREGQAAA